MQLKDVVKKYKVLILVLVLIALARSQAVAQPITYKLDATISITNSLGNEIELIDLREKNDALFDSNFIKDSKDYYLVKIEPQDILYSTEITHIKNNSISIFISHFISHSIGSYPMNFNIIRIQGTNVDTMKVHFLIYGLHLHKCEKLKYEIEFKNGDVFIRDSHRNLYKLFEKENDKSNLSPIDKCNYNYRTEKDIYYSLNDLISFDSIEQKFGDCPSDYLKYLSLYDKNKKINFSYNNKFDTLKINSNCEISERIKNTPNNLKLISNDSDYVLTLFPFNTIEKRESVLSSEASDSIYYLSAFPVGEYWYHINIKKLSSSEEMNIIYCCQYPIVFIPGNFLFIGNDDFQNFYWHDLHTRIENIENIETMNKYKELIIKNFKL